MMQLRTNYPKLVSKRADPELVKAKAFAEQGVVVANIDDHRLDPFERQFLKNIGSKLFGQKAGE